MDDIVLVPVGAEMPYILRPTDQGQYTFVGQACVHGILDGAVIELKEFGVEVPWFHLRLYSLSVGS